MCAVVVARSRRPQPTEVVFTAHAEVDRTLLSVAVDRPPGEVWITDISWTDPRVDRHLRRLAKVGTRLYWIDHHRTAISRHASRPSAAPFRGLVLDESRCAARLTYDFLRRRAITERYELPRDFAELEALVTLTDDHDRWIHHEEGSHQLADIVAEMRTREAYEELLAVDSQVTFSAKMSAAANRAKEGRRRSFAIAAETRVDIPAAAARAAVVAAECDGYASDIAAAWGSERRRAIFALHDRRSGTVGLRRSPDCKVDLSVLAERLGGGGHVAAAGFRPRSLDETNATGIARDVAAALERPGSN